ncbi:MAG: HAD family hydrolase [Pseudomonadota bacterium]
MPTARFFGTCSRPDTHDICLLIRIFCRNLVSEADSTLHQMSTISLISFDLDHTLFDFDRTLNEALLAVSRYLEIEGDYLVTPSKLQEHRNEIAATSDGGSMKLLDLRRASFAVALCTHPNKERLVEGAMHVFETSRFGDQYLYPGSESVLKTLSQSYRLAALTNGNTDPAVTSLAGLFEATIFAETYGYKKPDKRIFELMLSSLGIEDATSVLHVGDSLITDVQGANEAGLKSVWFNPQGKSNRINISPSYEVTSLEQLLDIAPLLCSS